ncbi:MAG: DUF1080 domain-containing protein [Planctomycetaceae bacterium]|nr:DUF1080 domain-containing protein [Planctomycetaceae bacterium]
MWNTRFLRMGSKSLAAFAIFAVHCLMSAGMAQEFEPLFNGKDLTGWVLVNTPPDTWKVEDGMLICSGRPIGEMRTEKMYQNFELELEWRHMVPKGNAGIFVWADDITARGVPFHRGVEVQVLENSYGNTQSHTTHGDIFPIHGAKMTPINGRGGDRAFPTEERSKPSPEWNHYRIVCQAGSIALSVNGKEVTRGTKATPSKGYICIESEGGVVHYRNVKIKVLPDTPIDDSQVAIAYRGYRSIYSGLDLRDWKPSQEGAWKVNDWVLDHAPDTKSNSNSLTYEKANSIEGFVIDFRLPEEKSSLSLQLPGIQEPLVLSADTASIAKSLVQRGSWNRIEGSITREGSQAKLTFVLNGDSHTIQGQPAEQSLRIDATHKVSLANIYIR